MPLPVLPDLEINRILYQRIRERKLMSEKEFADRAGVHQSTINRIIRGNFKYGRADVRRRIIQTILDLQWLDGQKPHPPSSNGYLIAPEVIALWPEVVHMLDSINALARAGEPELLKSVFRKLGEDGSRRLDQKEKRVTRKPPKKGGTRTRSPKLPKKSNK